MVERSAGSWSKVGSADRVFGGARNGDEKCRRKCEEMSDEAEPGRKG